MDKLLIVDDEPDITNVLRLILEAEGYQVVPALSGDEALSVAEIEAPDLVLLDLMMPGKSGLETCRHLKNQSRTRNIPVIIFSALGRDVDRKLTAEAGASVHLKKPFNNARLLTEVKRCLGEERGRKFSKQLGIEHCQLAGRKMLLEFEPRTDYERVVRDFAVECAFLGESVTILTRKGSSVRQALEGDQGIKLIDLERAADLLPVLNENSQGPVSIVVDGLTYFALEGNGGADGRRGMYNFVQYALGILDDPKFTALFLLNPSAHEPKEIAGVRGLFNNQFVYERKGINVAKLA